MPWGTISLSQSLPYPSCSEERLQDFVLEFLWVSGHIVPNRDIGHFVFFAERSLRSICEVRFRASTSDLNFNLSRIAFKALLHRFRCTREKILANQDFYLRQLDRAASQCPRLIGALPARMPWRRDLTNSLSAGLKAFGLGACFPKSSAYAGAWNDNAISRDPCSWTFVRLLWHSCKWRCSLLLCSWTFKIFQFSKTSSISSLLRIRRRLFTKLKLGSWSRGQCLAVSWSEWGKFSLLDQICAWVAVELILVWFPSRSRSFHWSGRACFQPFAKSINRNICLFKNPPPFP